MATILNATIAEGPHKGLTFGECLMIGKIIDIGGTNLEVDRKFLMDLRLKQIDESIKELQAKKEALIEANAA